MSGSEKGSNVEPDTQSEHCSAQMISLYNNKKLVVTSATLLVTGALLVVTRSY